MSEQEKKILDNIGKAIPLMTPKQKDKLADFLEGAAFMAKHQNQEAGKEASV